MSTTIRYTAAERASFELVPETCPHIEKAMDLAFKTPNFRDPLVAEVLAKYGLTVNDNLCYALDELVGRMLFARKRDLQTIVQLEGTFPLRLALVQQLKERHDLENEKDNYGGWLRFYRPRPPSNQCMHG